MSGQIEVVGHHAADDRVARGERVIGQEQHRLPARGHLDGTECRAFTGQLLRDGADQGDFAGQATKCVENMIVALTAAGATLSDIAYTRVLVASSDRHDLATVWSVVRDAFAGHEVPSTLFGVTVLGYENQLVEIEAVAAITR